MSGPMPHDALMALTDHALKLLPENALFGIAEPSNMHELGTGRDFIITRVKYVSHLSEIATS